MDTVIPLKFNNPAAQKAQEEKLRDADIQALLEAGVSMAQLEDLYGPSHVHRVAEAYITSTIPTGDETAEDDDAKQQAHRRSKLATLLFLRAPSSSLQSIMKSNDVLDSVFAALVSDPEDPLLMDPLLHTPLHDPVVLSSGIIVDRSTALDPETGKLRLNKCPFRRIPLMLPVYDVYPILEKVRAWEHDRLERCVNVARTMIHHQQYERAEEVFKIAYGFLQEHQQRLEARLLESGRSKDVPILSLLTTTSGSGNNAISSRHGSSREIMLLAIQLAQLERELPGVKDDIDRTVLIHKRIMLVAQACSSDKADLETLTRAALEDCWKRCSMLLAFAGKNASKKALGIRHAFAPLIKYTSLMQLNLTEELQKLCNLDLTLAKHVEDEPSIWNCRRVLLKLLPDDERDTFMEAEGIDGSEEDLYYHLLYDASLWPTKFIDSSIGLIHFGTNANNDNSHHGVPTETKGLHCKVNLNPLPNGDHWIEVAFRPDNIQSPGYLNSILSQHGDGSGWEIRCAVRPRPKFVFGNHNADPGGIHVEAVWTTSNGLGSTQHNEFTNPHVPLEIGTWYHVVLAYCCETSTLSLYVNGQVARHKVHGDFVPARALPKLGQNMQWRDRKFQGWIAFGGGGYELPVDGEDALDDHVQRLTKARLAKLPRQPALHKPVILLEDDDDVESSSGLGEDSSAMESISSSGMEDSGMEDDGEESSEDHDVHG